jgi:glycerol-3-phosphate acyltransferase PlsX
MNIGLDIMGGDYAPEEAIKGVISYLDSASGQEGNIHFTLFGKEEVCLPYLSLLENRKAHYTFVSCETVIGMHEHPTKAIKEKPDSSIAIGFSYLKSGAIDAFISAGNTGAMLVGAMYSVKAIEGVLRPTIASPIPKLNGKYNFLLDVGANADCKPEHLVQFALMGSLFARYIMKLGNPRVGLLNIGEEEGKGNLLAQATFPLLKQKQGINFIGNVEGRDLFLDAAEVIVCEGFAGNVALKMAESIYHIFAEKKQFKDPFLEQFNYESYGGTPILGVNAPVLIGHGISRAPAFRSMIENAINITASGLIDVLKEHFAPEAA